MIRVYATADGIPYAAADGSFIVVGTSLDLITDRTLADVESVRALETAIKAGTATEEQVHQYLNVHQKGTYTYEDLNRVENATAYVADRLRQFGYPHSLHIFVNWAVTDKPNESDFSRYFNNVAQLRSVIPVLATTPEAPTSVIGFDVHQANALEQILVDIDLILDRIKEAWFYANDIYSGEV